MEFTSRHHENFGRLLLQKVSIDCLLRLAGTVASFPLWLITNFIDWTHSPKVLSFKSSTMNWKEEFLSPFEPIEELDSASK